MGTEVDREIARIDRTRLLFAAGAVCLAAALIAIGCGGRDDLVGPDAPPGTGGDSGRPSDGDDGAGTPKDAASSPSDGGPTDGGSENGGEGGGGGGAGGNAGSAGGSGEGGSGEGGSDAGGACADGDAQCATEIPVVMFLIDRSGSMAESFAGGSASRWDVVHDALMEPTTGAIAKNQTTTRIGVVLFTGPVDPALLNPFCNLIPGSCPDGGSGDAGADAGVCPELIIVEPALNNHDSIAEHYTADRAGPGATTPTALAMAETFRILLSYMSQTGASAQPAPAVILITDGQPNSCGGDTSADPDYDGPIAEVTAAASQGIRTFVIGIDILDGAVQENIDILALLGHTGVGSAYQPTTEGELAAALDDIIGRL